MDEWKRLEFLIGSWSSPMSGQPGEGVTGSSTFSYQLDRKIMVRNSRAEFAPQPGQEKGLVHEDLIVIYPQIEDEQLRAIYFDNEGHVLHYKLSFPEKQLGVVFETNGSSGPRARLAYQMAPDGCLEVEFFVGGTDGELISHVRGKLVREETKTM